jgi:hypothetical protein
MKTIKAMKKMLAVILIPLLLLTGYLIIDRLAKNIVIGKKTDNDSGVTTGTGDQVNNGFEDFEVTIADTPLELMEFPSRSIGNATFKVETSKKTIMKYPADGKAQSVSVMDASRIEWTLQIPDNALIDEEEISITPLNNIELDRYPGSMLHGILLEPDGLEFLKSSSITIKKAGETIKGVVLTSEHDGSEVILSPSEAHEEGIKAPVQHFSTLLLVPEDDEITEEFKDFAKAQYEMALEYAERLLEKPLSVPAPPSISPECMNEGKEEQVKEYGELVCKEEEEIVSRIWSANRTQWVLSGGMEMNLPPVFFQLLHRMNAKVRKLKSQYEPEPEKFMPVFNAAIRAWKKTSFFIEAPAPSAFLSWAEKARKHYMDKLNKDHDFKAFGAAFHFDRVCSLLGGDSILQRIINSMTFKLNVDVQYHTPGYPITIKGEGTLKPSYEEGGIETIYSMYDKTLYAQGEITLKYEYTGEDEDLTIEPEEFTVMAQIRNINPCKSDKINILIEAFGSDDETYVYEQTYGEYRDSYPWVKEESEMHFEKERKEVPCKILGEGVIALEMFDFEVSLNKEAMIADETFRREQSMMDKWMVVKLQLEHTPN